VQTQHARDWAHRSISLDWGLYRKRQVLGGLCLRAHIAWSPATYILCAVLLFIWIIPDLWEIEAREKNTKIRNSIFKSFKILVRVKSTMGATE